MVVLKLADVDVEGLDENSHGADGCDAYNPSGPIAPHPVVVDAVAVDAKELVDECFDKGFGVSGGCNVLVIILLATAGLEAQSSSSKQMLQVAVGIFKVCINS